MNDTPDEAIHERAIRERAYAIWQEEGQPHGRADQHWQQACAELADAQARAARDMRSDGAGMKDKIPRRTSRNSVGPKTRASGKSGAPPKARAPSRAPRQSS